MGSSDRRVRLGWTASPEGRTGHRVTFRAPCPLHLTPASQCTQTGLRRPPPWETFTTGVEETRPTRPMPEESSIVHDRRERTLGGCEGSGDRFFPCRRSGSIGARR